MATDVSPRRKVEDNIDVEVVDEFRPSYWAYNRTMWLTILTFPFTWGVPLLYAWWKRRHTKYIVTDEKIVKEYDGFSGKKQDVVRRDNITRVRTSQSAWEKMRDRGTVLIETSTVDFELKGVSNHEDMMRRLAD